LLHWADAAIATAPNAKMPISFFIEPSYALSGAWE
jgi:hypothetical protein